MEIDTLTINQIEAAINRLRELSSGDGVTLAPGVGQLAELYGRMIWFRLGSVSVASLTAGEMAALAIAA